MNALTILKQDHGNVETLFRRFEDQGERAHTTKRRTVDKIIEQLSVHAAVEEQVFYPAVRDCGAQPEELVLEALEEHHVVKWTLHELERMAPTAERFDAKVKVLIESVRLHIEEEEKGLFPKVREKLSGPELAALGEAIEKARKGAPTRPHPRSPDTPPLNVVMGTAVAIVDRATQPVREVVGRVLRLGG